MLLGLLSESAGEADSALRLKLIIRTDFFVKVAFAMIVCEQQSAIVIFLVVGALIAQLGERQTEDLKVPCSIHGQSREISTIIPCNEVKMCAYCKKYKGRNTCVLLRNTTLASDRHPLMSLC